MMFQTTYDSSSGAYMNIWGTLPWFYIPRDSTATISEQAAVVFGEITATLENIESRPMLSIFGSGFSVEDMPSYLIGFLIADTLREGNLADAYYTGQISYQQIQDTIRIECDVPTNVDHRTDVYDVEPESYRSQNRSFLPPDRAPELDHICHGPCDINRLPDWLFNGALFVQNSYQLLGSMITGRNTIFTTINTDCSLVNAPYPNDPNNPDSPISLYECGGC